MEATNPVQIIDLFAGPGGLGEGFASQDDTFETIVSAEMDPAAHQTLRLRAYFRILKREKKEELLEDYYAFCHDSSKPPFTDRTKQYWDAAGNEAQRITLGTIEGNDQLDKAISAGRNPLLPLVLIGGPPCQAYSLVGRARNKGKASYVAEDDHRHFLYREYLRIIQQHVPDVFVMENVKGILSSRVDGRHIFHEILQDLADPGRAIEGQTDGVKYLICSLVSEDIFHSGDDPEIFDARKFIVRAEEYGIPQARHRVILLGLKASRFERAEHLRKSAPVSVEEVIGSLPTLRSKLSKQADTSTAWQHIIREHLVGLIDEMKQQQSTSKISDITDELLKAENGISLNLDAGSLRHPIEAQDKGRTGPLEDWYADGRLRVWLNHEARGHMSTDLRRYLFAAAFAKARRYSPKGPEGFNLPSLRPDHKNWESGKFSDRFRVQLGHGPSTTVTSHISKDGHYFIHPDPAQCRSLTVREAARLQTFPDNYFFQGNRTEQYHQVGNAVPPLLARSIAVIVKKLFHES